jgi:hypothetical protein
LSRFAGAGLSSRFHQGLMATRMALDDNFGITAAKYYFMGG